MAALVLAFVVAACGQGAGSPSGPTAPPGTGAPVAAPTDTTAPASVAPAASPIPTLADPVRRIPLPGSAPAAIAVTADATWVYSIESGDITSVAGITQTIHVGGLGSHLVPAGGGRLVVGRFDNGGSGDYLLLVDPASGGIDGFSTGPIGSVAVGDDGDIYALEKAGRLLRVDPSTGSIVGSGRVDVHDEHMEVVVTDGSAWAASDHTPLQRLALPELTVTDSIDVGGGIPFVVADGRIWGARPGTMWVLDPATKAVVREIPLPGVEEILGMDVDPATDEAWFAVRLAGRVGAVLRMDLSDGSFTGTARVSLPAAVRIVGQQVLVASYLDNELLVYGR